MSELPVNEIFESIQGEGSHCGRPALFIRFQGCNVKCNWCDTKYAWNLDSINNLLTPIKIIQKDTPNPFYHVFETDDLVDFITKHYPVERDRFIVLTGGEPLMHPIDDLVKKLGSHGYYLQLETSGCHKIEKLPHYLWITLSPKKCTLKENFEICDEIKLVVNDPDDIKLIELPTNYQHMIYLQPGSCNPSMTRFCVEQCLAHRFKLSVQIHKYIDIK